MKPSTFAPSKSKSSLSTLDASDNAARYLDYKLSDATRGNLGGEWHDLKGIGEGPETVARAAERGWVVVREDKGKARSAALTERWEACGADGTSVRGGVGRRDRP